MTMTKPPAPLDADTVKAVRAFVGKMANHYPLIDALLFGSRARRDHRPHSDADIAVIMRGTHGRRFDEALKMADMAFEVMLETGVLIEALPLWEDEWLHPETFANPGLIETIRREGVRV